MTKREIAYEVDRPVRTAKRCPSCGATNFQGPLLRGPIVNGELQPREVLYQCVGCNTVKPIGELEDYELPKVVVTDRGESRSD